ncbi:homoserine kinase [soil metagenome]
MAEASAPASSANLGPGFDVLALALELRCRVKASLADRWSIEHGEGQRPDVDSDDAVMAAARAAVGDEVSLRLQVNNDIPIGRGLGSSAAALAAGAAAALAARDGEADPEKVFELVAGIEGHPDNAAAAVYGGLVVVGADGRPLRLDIHPALKPLVAVPVEVFLTAEARRVVPDTVTRAVVVRTVARAAALVAGFITGDHSMLAAAQGDEIHEGPRSAARPETKQLLARAREAGALHAAWSGSGPSIFALVAAEDRESVATALQADSVSVLSLEVADTGLTVSA